MNCCFSASFPTSLTSWEGSLFPVLSSGVGCDRVPPRNGPYWRKEIRHPDILTTDWFMDEYITQSKTFSESSGKNKPPSSTRGIKDTFFFLVDMNKEECNPAYCWCHLVFQREKLHESQANI